MKPYTQKLLAGVLAAGLPVAYMVAVHLSWMPDTNARLRMGAKHLGFWGGLAGTLVFFHQQILKKKQSLGASLGLAVVFSLLPVIGYEAMRRVAKKIFPKPPKVTSKEQPRLEDILASLTPNKPISPSVSTMGLPANPKPYPPSYQPPYSPTYNSPYMAYPFVQPTFSYPMAGYGYPW